MLEPVTWSKQRTYTDDLEKVAREFHGHGGPFLIIGLRMGIKALGVLDSKGWFNLRCIAYLRWEPPVSCVIDGIQISTGCTMGKHNIEVLDDDGVQAVFCKGDDSIELKVRDEVLKMVKESFKEENSTIDELLEWLREVDDNEIFLLN